MWVCLYDSLKLLHYPVVESDGYGGNSIRKQSGCEFKIAMMVCCFDAEYVSLLNLLHGMHFFPSTNTFLHPGNPSYSSV